MEGRWARLAISAFTQGCLDFSKTTREDRRSIIQESLVIDELERHRFSNAFQLKTLAAAMLYDDAGASSQSNLNEYIALQVPWVVSKKDGPPKIVSSQEDEVAKLIDMYNKYQEHKKQESD